MEGIGRVSRRAAWAGDGRAYGCAVLPDGTYDVFVVDAEAGEAAGEMRLDVTILDGPHKGEVVAVQAQGFQLDEVDALGTPGTLTVRDGSPSLVLEP